MTWLVRRLVRLARRRRYAETAHRIRTLEIGLGLTLPTFTEMHANPDLIDWRSSRAGRRERARWEAQRDAARRYGGQCSPWGVVRPPIITTQAQLPPPVTYVPE